MASIGNITAAAAAARFESTVALANVHLEFNMFTKRLNPPAEYEGVGQNFTKLRLKEAQDGAPHTTARKLGLLFKNVLSPTPELIKAYGTRASEIAKSANANAKGGRERLLVWTIRNPCWDRRDHFVGRGYLRERRHPVPPAGLHAGSDLGPR